MLRDFFIAGKMGAGKDTIAEFLVPYGYEHLSIAQPLKDVATILYPWVMKVGGVEKRKLLQKLGDHLRKFDKLVFLKALEDRIKQAWDKGKRVVVSDVRLRIEYEFLRKLGFVPLKVVVDDEIRLKRLLKRDGYIPDEAASRHATETELEADDLYFVYIDNNGSFEDLKRQVDELVEEPKGLFKVLKF